VSPHGEISIDSRGGGGGDAQEIDRFDRSCKEMRMFGKMSFAAALVALTGVGGVAMAENAPGVTATEIRIGQTMPYSGPASAYAVIGRTDAAFFKMINDRGGINGRKIVLLSEDDSYSPAKAVEATRKLVEQDQVAFIFNTLGTPSNTAIQKYLNDKKIPQLFINSGADKFSNYKDFPWTIAYTPSYRTEAQIFAKYILKVRPNAKIGILYQNDDFGKDYIAGFKDVLGSRYQQMVVKEASYEVTDPTLDTQIIALQASGADTLLTAATPKFAAQTIRKVYTLGWKPMFFLSQVSASISAVLEPVGLEKSIGIISAAYQKDPVDPSLKNDAGLSQWRNFMQGYMPDADPTDGNYIAGFNVGMLLVQVLKQCGNDLSRENIMRQATNIKNLELPALLPGVRVNTSPTNYHPVRQVQLMRWDGRLWVRFGDVFEGAEQS
jgi:branched-chain amino acid transport system substrate-binding protein